MDFLEYINGLNKITIQDIKNIIDNDLKNNKTVEYIFREQRGYILFGEPLYGGIPSPQLLICANADDLCEQLYNMLQENFSSNCEYSYIHSFNGDNDYYGIINDGTVRIYFPNFNVSQQEWINKQIYCGEHTKKMG